MNSLLLVLTLTSSVLVLQSGDRIAVEGDLTERDGVYTFRNGGALYSVRTSEVLRIETTVSDVEEKPVKKLRLSEEERKRLIEELEKNHGGTPPPPQRLLDQPSPAPPPQPTGPGESEWRSRARMHEEDLRRAHEDLELLERRIEGLRDEILGLLNLGYRPRQFTWQTTQLARAEEQLPYARLEVRRAERALAQFKEDARRAGVLPGWLR